MQGITTKFLRWPIQSINQTKPKARIYKRQININMIDQLPLMLQNISSLGFRHYIQNARLLKHKRMTQVLCTCGKQMCLWSKLLLLADKSCKSNLFFAHTCSIVESSAKYISVQRNFFFVYTLYVLLATYLVQTVSAEFFPISIVII